MDARSGVCSIVTVRYLSIQQALDVPILIHTILTTRILRSTQYPMTLVKQIYIKLFQVKSIYLEDKS